MGARLVLEWGERAPREGKKTDYVARQYLGTVGKIDLRKIIFGQRRKRTYWEITTDPETMPENSTSFVMTNIQEKRSQMKKILGNLTKEG